MHRSTVPRQQNAIEGSGTTCDEAADRERRRDVRCLPLCSYNRCLPSITYYVVVPLIQFTKTLSPRFDTKAQEQF